MRYLHLCPWMRTAACIIHRHFALLSETPTRVDYHVDWLEFSSTNQRNWTCCCCLTLVSSVFGMAWLPNWRTPEDFWTESSITFISDFLATTKRWILIFIQVLAIYLIYWILRVGSKLTSRVLKTAVLKNINKNFKTRVSFFIQTKHNMIQHRYKR